MFLTSFSLILLFSKLWTMLSCKRLRFVIIKPFRVDLDVNHVLISGLAFVWVLMHICRSLLLCKVISPGVNPTTIDGMILYYCFMTKVDWFRRQYGIFLGGFSHYVTNTMECITKILITRHITWKVIAAQDAQTNTKLKGRKRTSIKFQWQKQFNKTYRSQQVPNININTTPWFLKVTT
jgi:hypothetical protein